MKVLHIISGGDSGGAKTHLLTLCTGNRQFENTIGCINKGILYEEARNLSIDTVLFEQLNRADFRAADNINEYIIKNNIDVVNFHGARANFLHMHMKHNLEIPGVTTVHSDYRYDFINNRLKQFLFTPLNAMALRGFNKYICVSRKIAELLNEKGYKGDKFIVQNGVDTSQTIRKSRSEIREKLGIPEEAFLYTMVARFHPVKNHMMLIKAFRRLMDVSDNTWLMLVGSGDMEEQVKSAVTGLDMTNRVIFAGQQRDVLDYMNAGNINILTSLNETFSLVILEGGLVKKPAICSDVGDIKDIIDKETGFIINPNSVDDIYDKMKQAYDCRDTLHAMGDNLYEKVINNYTIDKFHEKYYNAYRAIITGEKNGKTIRI